jgi:Tfp pilus assembly protein PilF
MSLRSTLSFLVLMLTTQAIAQEDGYPDESFRLADQYIAAQDLPKARAALEKGLKRVPDHAGGWVNLGNIMLIEQDWVGAQSSFEQALTVDPAHYLAMNGMGTALLGLEDYDPAIEWFLRAVETKPEYITPLINLGRISVLRNQAAPAIKYYALALEVDPNAREPNLALAELHIIGELYQHVDKYLLPVLAANPEDVEALELQGRSLLGQGLPLRALDPLLRAQQADPAVVSTQRLVGIACMNTEQWGCAEDAFRAAIVLQPDDAQLHLELGQLYRTAGQETWDRAMWHFNKTSQLDPSLASPWFEMAALEEDLQRPEDASVHYERAIQLQPDHCPSLSNLARLKKLGGDPATAELLLDRCLSSDPGFVLAILNRGWVRADAGMCEGARADLQPLSQRQDSWGEQARALLTKCPE